jgi:hypothetical protein
MYYLMVLGKCHGLRIASLLQKDMLKSWPPVIEHVIIFGNRAIAAVISSVKMRSYWSKASNTI